MRIPAAQRNDLLLALLVYLIGSLISADRIAPTDLRSACAVAILLPLTLRRVAPRFVLELILLLILVVAVFVPPYHFFLAPLVALYTVASLLGLADSLRAWAATVTAMSVAVVIAELRSSTEFDPTPSTGAESILMVVVFAALSAGCWGLGRWVGLSRDTVRTLRENREKAAAEAVLAERQRVAHELHDIVSHSVGLIVLQAAGARRSLAGDPGRAEQALATIEDVGRQSLDELRRLLGVLQDGGLAARGTDDGTKEGEQLGLDDLDQLAASIRLAGLTVRLATSGVAARLDPSVDLAAYRVAQEALTNSLKHAGPDAIATVCLDWEPDRLLIGVTDDGSGSGDPELSTGHGLPGLGERLRAAGGQLLEAAPMSGGGFRVRATLPLSVPNGGSPG